MDAKELREYKRRLRLREQRRTAVQKAAGFSDYPGRGRPRARSNWAETAAGNYSGSRAERAAIGRGD